LLAWQAEAVLALVDVDVAAVVVVLVLVLVLVDEVGRQLTTIQECRFAHL